MFDLATILLPIAAVGYSLIYLLFGGAALILIIAKAFGNKFAVSIHPHVAVEG